MENNIVILKIVEIQHNTFIQKIKYDKDCDKNGDFFEKKNDYFKWCRFVRHASKANNV